MHSVLQEKKYFEQKCINTFNGTGHSIGVLKKSLISTDGVSTS